MNANLANDESVRSDVYTADIVWQGREAEVLVLAMGRRPLLGTALLAGWKLAAEFVDDGLVTIDDV